MVRRQESNQAPFPLQNVVTTHPEPTTVYLNIYLKRKVPPLPPWYWARPTPHREVVADTWKGLVTG